MSGGQIAGRVLSVVVVVAMLVGAFALRNRDGNDAAGDDGEVTVEAGVVWCAAELRICDDLRRALGADWDVEVGDGVDQFDELASSDQAPTAWVTLQSLVDMTRDRRDRTSRPALLETADPIATSPLVLVGVGERLAALESDCGGTLDWSCIGEAAGGSWADHGGQASWGRVRPAHEGLDDSGVALLVLAQAVANRADVETLSTRVYDDPDVALWLSDLEQAMAPFSPASGSQLRQMIQQPGTIDVVGTTAAEAASVFAVAASRVGGLTVIPGAPAVSARATVATPVGADVPSEVADAVAELLAEAGWEGAGTPGVTLTPPVRSSEDDLAFSGGALEALRQEWDQVR